MCGLLRVALNSALSLLLVRSILTLILECLNFYPSPCGFSGPHERLEVAGFFFFFFFLWGGGVGVQVHGCFHISVF